MTPEVQTLVALTIVAITVALLARSVWKKRKAPGCGGGCGCPSGELKAKLKR